MNEPMFSCCDEFCRVEVSYPAGMLAVGPDGPVCQVCWDSQPHEGHWNDLPAFVPEYRKQIAELVEVLRIALNLGATYSKGTGELYSEEMWKARAVLAKATGDAR